MCAIHARVRVANDARSDVEDVDVDAVIDLDAMYSCLPARLAQQLKLHDRGFRDMQGADGHVQRIRYVSPVRVEVAGRVGVTGALVIGDQVRLGAISVKDMDLVVDPLTATLIVNPLSPAVPRSLVL